jgi:hypothetical protein
MARPIRMRRLLVLLAAGLALPGAGVAAPELPQLGPDVHLGVKTCSGAPCHGNVAAVGKVVLQNEYTTWSRRDAHAQAYAVLLEERSREIATRLGLREPAHESPLCLDCHADHVATERRGEQFALEDGVGCEACHGGAERWLGAHVSGSGDHADYVAKGLYPTDDPVARATLCVSCHFGTERKFVGHRIMGAGHPRMSFELDTFTQIQPAHFVVDEDYAGRGKRASEAVQVWAIGQAVAVREVLDALLDPKRARQGVWPELVLYDCHACHHPMSDRRWAPRGTTGLPAGVARLNDSSFLMLSHALAGLDPAAARELRAGMRRLHAALSLGSESPERVAGGLRDRVSALVPRLAAWEPAADDVRRITASLLADGIAGEYRDYASAEQAMMALQSLATTLHDQGALDDARLASVRGELDRFFEATRDDERYRPGALPPVLQRLREHLRAR